MRLALTVLTTLTLLGCSGDSALPTAPAAPLSALNLSPPSCPAGPPTPGGPAWLWAMVVEDSGICILDATIEVICGQAFGQIGTQTEECNVWGYSGGVIFTGLRPGLTMTLRASARGYAPQEKIVVPTLGPQMAEIFDLSRIP
jgi:hypothetical protein